MIREIEARSLLQRVKQPDHWFGLRYNLNLYRGCQHRCIYCDTRSTCYGIENFDSEVLVKGNAIDLLRRELARLRIKGTIGTGSMNDPYMPLEREIGLTAGALGVIDEFDFPVHVITKSNLVTRDIPLLRSISRTYAAVTFSITTADDDLARKVEPGAPVSSRRFAAMEELAGHGILTGLCLMPVLPYLEDSERNITALVQRARESGAGYIIPSFGLTMRDGQRQHLYDSLDRLFPGLRSKYEQRYGDNYSCPVPRAGRLEKQFRELCVELGIPTAMRVYSTGAARQMDLF